MPRKYDPVTGGFGRQAHFPGTVQVLNCGVYDRGPLDLHVQHCEIIELGPWPDEYSMEEDKVWRHLNEKCVRMYCEKAYILASLVHATRGSTAASTLLYEAGINCRANSPSPPSSLGMEGYLANARSQARQPRGQPKLLCSGAECQWTPQEPIHLEEAPSFEVCTVPLLSACLNCLSAALQGVLARYFCPSD